MMGTHTSLDLSVRYAMVRYEQITLYNSRVCVSHAVFGYVAGTRVQTLPEGMDSDLTIGVVKPPAGIGLQFPLNFLIQNADNTGKL